MFTNVEIIRIQSFSKNDVVAMANITVAGCLKLTGIRVVDSPNMKEPKVLLPSRMTARGLSDFYYFLTAPDRAAFENAILDAYLKTP